MCGGVWGVGGWVCMCVYAHLVYIERKYKSILYSNFTCNFRDQGFSIFSASTLIMRAPKR